jgi:hypothetical protein
LSSLTHQGHRLAPHGRRLASSPPRNGVSGLQDVNKNSVIVASTQLCKKPSVLSSLTLDPTSPCPFVSVQDEG